MRHARKIRTAPAPSGGLRAQVIAQVARDGEPNAASKGLLTAGRLRLADYTSAVRAGRQQRELGRQQPVGA